MHIVRVRSIRLAIALLIALFVIACGGENPAPAADERDAQALFDATFNEVPEDLAVVSIPEGASRATVSATYAGSDIADATATIRDALIDSGWTIVSDDADEDRGNIVGKREPDDIQVELTRGDPFSSVNIIFAAPGEGL